MEIEGYKVSGKHRKYCDTGHRFDNSVGDRHAPGGDINNDNVVSIGDFNLLKGSFGRQAGEPGFNSNADFTCDGAVSAGDFNLLRNNFGRGGAPALRSEN